MARASGYEWLIAAARASFSDADDSVEVVVEEVGVDVQGHRGGRVPQHPLHRLHVRSRADRERCRRVAKVVDCHALEAGRVECRHEPGPRCARGPRATEVVEPVAEQDHRRASCPRRASRSAARGTRGTAPIAPRASSATRRGCPHRHGLRSRSRQGAGARHPHRAPAARSALPSAARCRRRRTRASSTRLMPQRDARSPRG